MSNVDTWPSFTLTVKKMHTIQHLICKFMKVKETKFPSTIIPWCRCLRVCTALIRYQGQMQLSEDRVYFSLHVPTRGWHAGKSKPELNVGTWKQNCIISYAYWLAPHGILNLLYNPPPRYLPMDSITSSELEPFSSIVSQEKNPTALPTSQSHRDIFSIKTPLPRYVCFICQVDKTQPAQMVYEAYGECWICISISDSKKKSQLKQNN